MFPQFSRSLDPDRANWLPVPKYTVTLVGDRLQVAVYSDRDDVSVVYFRLIRVVP